MNIDVDLTESGIQTITLEQYRRNLEHDKQLPIPIVPHRRGHPQENS